MSRISMSTLVSAIKKVRAMDIGQKEQLADELFRQQPNMFGSVLVQQQMGVSLEKMEFSLEILFICFQCMKESGLTWPLITEAEQDKQLARYVATVKFGEGLSPKLQDCAMKQYLDSHPEQYLLAFVTAETNGWIGRIFLGRHRSPRHAGRHQSRQLHRLRADAAISGQDTPPFVNCGRWRSLGFVDRLPFPCSATWYDTFGTNASDCTPASERPEFR